MRAAAKWIRLWSVRCSILVRMGFGVCSDQPGREIRRQSNACASYILPWTTTSPWFSENGVHKELETLWSAVLRHMSTVFVTTCWDLQLTISLREESVYTACVSRHAVCSVFVIDIFKFLSDWCIVRLVSSVSLITFLHFHVIALL